MPNLKPIFAALSCSKQIHKFGSFTSCAVDEIETIVFNDVKSYDEPNELTSIEVVVRSKVAIAFKIDL